MTSAYKTFCKQKLLLWIFVFLTKHCHIHALSRAFLYRLCQGVQHSLILTCCKMAKRGEGKSFCKISSVRGRQNFLKHRNASCWLSILRIAHFVIHCTSCHISPCTRVWIWSGTAVCVPSYWFCLAVNKTVVQLGNPSFEVTGPTCVSCVFTCRDGYEVLLMEVNRQNALAHLECEQVLCFASTAFTAKSDASMCGL